MSDLHTGKPTKLSLLRCLWLRTATAYVDVDILKVQTGVSQQNSQHQTQRREEKQQQQHNKTPEQASVTVFSRQPSLQAADKRCGSPRQAGEEYTQAAPGLDLPCLWDVHGNGVVDLRELWDDETVIVMNCILLFFSL